MIYNVNTIVNNMGSYSVKKGGGRLSTLYKLLGVRYDAVLDCCECTNTVSCIWPDDGSIEPKHVAEFLKMIAYTRCVTD
jgi:hypothetical protein